MQEMIKIMSMVRNINSLPADGEGQELLQKSQQWAEHIIKDAKIQEIVEYALHYDYGCSLPESEITNTVKLIRDNQLDRETVKSKALAYIIERQIDIRLHSMRYAKQEEEYNRRKAERQAEYEAAHRAEYEAAKAEYEAAQAAEQAEQQRIAEEERQAVEGYFRQIDASTQENVEKAFIVLEKYKTQQEELNNNLLFRGEPAKWVVGFKSYNKKVKDPFDGTITIEERRKQTNLISYEGKEYEREDFLQAHFESYKKHAYKVKFKNDDVLWLGSSRRVKLVYDILAQRFPLVEVAEQDKRDLEQLAANNQEKVYQIWRDHMKWEQGHEKMITFGAALDVRMKKADGKYTSAAKGVYCYEIEITGEYAKYKGVAMSWESWSVEIKRQLDLGRWTMYKFAKTDFREQYKRVFVQTMRQATIAMYYQNGVYLTLPKKEIDTIEEWKKKYFKDGKAEFPYEGDIPNADVSFTIDFAADVEIVRAQDLKNNMAEYNKGHNAEHNREVIGRNKVLDTFSRLTGNEWSRAEILAQGFNGNNITRFVEYGLIERTSRGQYKRKTC